MTILTGPEQLLLQSRGAAVALELWGWWSSPSVRIPAAGLGAAFAFTKEVKPSAFPTSRVLFRTSPAPAVASHNPPHKLIQLHVKTRSDFVATALNGELTVINRVDILLLSSKFAQSKPRVWAAKAAVS